MAVVVSSRGKTKVKRVVVGKPIRRIDPTQGSIDTIGGVDTSGKENGSVLVYNSSSEKFEATRTLENQDVNGGQY